MPTGVDYLVLTAISILLFNFYSKTILEGWNSKSKKRNWNSAEFAEIKQRKIKA